MVVVPPLLDAVVWRGATRVAPLSCATMRISHNSSDGSALMRLMSAAPRDFDALHDHDVGPVDQDGFECRRGLRVREGQRFGVLGALAQGNQLIGFGDEDRGQQDIWCIGGCQPQLHVSA